MSCTAGVAKSFLIKTIFQTPTKTLNLYSGAIENTKVLKMVPVGVAAVEQRKWNNH